MPDQPSTPEKSNTLARSSVIRHLPSRKTLRMAFTQNWKKQRSKASESSGSGSKAGGKAQSSTGGDATAVTSTASVEAQIAAAVSAWDQKTDEEKEAWGAELFRDEGLPWQGEVAYDDEGDIEYEEKIAEAWRKR